MDKSNKELQNLGQDEAIKILNSGSIITKTFTYDFATDGAVTNTELILGYTPAHAMIIGGYVEVTTEVTVSAGDVDIGDDDVPNIYVDALTLQLGTVNFNPAIVPRYKHARQSVIMDAVGGITTAGAFSIVLSYYICE